MRKEIFILFCFLLFLIACPEPEKTKDDVAATENTNRQQTNDAPPANASQISPPTPQPNADKSPSIVKADGQNITYSTAGELEIVGSETNYDIILPTDILFDFDKHELRPEANELLKKLKAHFDSHKTDQVHVWGHTDSKGDDVYNFKLSQKRAIAVQKWLKENTGVYAMALGRGESEPLVPNENPDGSDNPENRQRNRRVVVSVVAYPNVNKMLKKHKQ